MDWRCASHIVAFRSAKGRAFAERKATMFPDDDSGAEPFAAGRARGRRAIRARTQLTVGEFARNPVVEPYPLERANDALTALRKGRLRGAAVLTTGFVSASVAL
jgi:hypothetical protein